MADKRIETWTALAEALAPHITASDPLDALRRAGHEPGGAVAEALRRNEPRKRFDPDGFQRLQDRYGPPLPRAFA